MTSRFDRIVVINDDSVQSGGAAAIALASLAELRARGVSVTLITGDDGANPELARMGVDVVALNGRHVFNGQRPAIARGLFDRRVAKDIAAWIRQNDTPRTIYHMHNWHKVLSPAAFVPLRRVARRLIVTAHDYFLACPNGGYFHYPRGELCCLKPMSAPCIMQACDKRNYGHKLWRVARGEIRHRAMNLRTSPATVIAVHEGMVPLLAHTVAQASIHVLRNPSMPWVTTRVAAERNRRLLFVGRLEHDKGVMHLAKAARIAGAPLRIIGSGPLASILRCDFPEVELAGWRSKEEIGRMCRDVRALVMPSQWRETFGLSAVEAAMSGIPTIASRASLICSDLEQHGIGIGCDAQDVTAMANTIKRVMSDDALVEQMSHAGFERGRQISPTPTAWGDLLVALYAEKLTGAELGQPASTRTRTLHAAVSDSPARI